MLTTNIKKFETDVKQILESSMYETLTNSFIQSGDGVIDKYVKDGIDDAAKKMSKVFAESAAKPLTQAINDHIKSAGIIITIPPTAMALTCAVGPVTGTISVTPVTSNIEIV